MGIEAPPVDRIESISSWHIKQWTQDWSGEEDGGGLDATEETELGLFLG
jgi:hypothetical protein